jgi:hypothetical protein
MLRPAERQGLERWEVDALSRPLAVVPASLAAPGELPVGGVGGGVDGAIDWVITGICLGPLEEDKRRWLRGGPTVEAVCGLDYAARLARLAGARLLVWIVDAEYANTAAASASPGEASEGLDEALGAAVEAFVYARYPDANVRRTVDVATRAELYGRLSARDVAAAYPRGVAAPNGARQPTLWQELQFLVCVATMILPGPRSLVVVDSDQLRALAAAHARTGVSGLVYLPVPQLGWRAPPPSDLVQWSNAALEAPRRMQRGPAGNRLHLGEPMPMPHGWNADAAREVAWYLTGDPAWETRQELPDLDACVRARRELGTPSAGLGEA